MKTTKKTKSKQHIFYANEDLANLIKERAKREQRTFKAVLERLVKKGDECYKKINK